VAREKGEGSDEGPEAPVSLPNAEAAEDQIQNVIRTSFACNRVERPQGSIKIEHDHLMGDFAGGGVAGRVQAGERFFH